MVTSQKIKILDVTEHQSTADDGAKVFEQIKPALLQGQSVEISFAGIYSVPSSFINAAFIELLDHFTFDHIKASLHFVDSTRYINQANKDRFHFEVERMMEAPIAKQA